MSESILLAICGIVIVACVILGRHAFNSQKMTALTSRQEALGRLALTVVAAFVVHLFYAPGPMGFTFWLTVFANAFLVYGATHFFDRVVDRVGRVAAR